MLCIRIEDSDDSAYVALKQGETTNLYAEQDQIGPEPGVARPNPYSSVSGRVRSQDRRSNPAAR